MTTKILGLLLPLAFILHNVEEYWSFDEFKKFYLRAVDVKYRRKKVFLYALIVLSLVVSGIGLLNFFMSSMIVQSAMTIVTVGLLLNGIQHIVTSLWARKALPGLFTACILLIPLSLIYLIFLEKEIHFGLFDIALWVVLALILTLLSIRFSLWIGYLLTKGREA